MVKYNIELNFTTIENGNWYEKRPCKPIDQRRGSAPRFGRFCRRCKKQRRAEYRRVQWRGSNPSSKPYQCDLRVSESLSAPSSPIAFPLCIHRKHWPVYWFSTFYSAISNFLTLLHATRQRKLVKMILTNRQKQITNWAAANSPRREHRGKLATYWCTFLGNPWVPYQNYTMVLDWEYTILYES